MRFLIADSYYPGFLRSFYSKNPALASASYSVQLEQLIAARFGHSDYYSRNLRGLGHDASDVVFNARQLQLAWARENAPGLAKWARIADQRWDLRVFEEQVRRQAPDVLFIHDMAFLPAPFVHHLAGLVGMIVGQVASPVDFSADWTGYDLVLSSLPHFVDHFRGLGVRADYLPLAFESTLLAEITTGARDLKAVFVGSFSAVHESRTELLEQLATTEEIDYWGTGTESLASSSAIHARFRGPAWGSDMLALLGGAQVSLNRHIDVADGFANNMRLFESTGMGACLLTDDGRNLPELFVPGVEVVTYKDADDCRDRLRYLLANDDERRKIAEAGRRRTLKDHTYARRMEQLLVILEDVPIRSTVASTAVASYTSGRPSAIGLAKRLVAESSVGPGARRLYRTVRSRGGADVSAGHVPISSEQVDSWLVDGWRDASIPARQRKLVSKELADVRAGRPAAPFRIASEALDATGLTTATFLEIGCASGYYSEALALLAKTRVEYVGVDYSVPLVSAARSHYPGLPFVVADAARLPFADAAFDVVMSAAVIMHMPHWRDAISEMARVAGEFCILHRTPVARTSSTAWYRKKAYGVDVVELLFNEAELIAQLRSVGVEIVGEWPVGESVLPGLPEPACVKTYLGRLHA